MKVVKKTPEFIIYKRADGRYAVRTARRKRPVNGRDKIKILVEEGLLNVPVPPEPKKEEPKTEAPAGEAAAEGVKDEKSAEPPAEAKEEAKAEEKPSEPAPAKEVKEEPKAEEKPAEEKPKDRSAPCGASRSRGRGEGRAEGGGETRRGEAENRSAPCGASRPCGRSEGRAEGGGETRTRAALRREQRVIRAPWKTLPESGNLKGFRSAGTGRKRGVCTSSYLSGAGSGYPESLTT